MKKKHASPTRSPKASPTPFPIFLTQKQLALSETFFSPAAAGAAAIEISQNAFPTKSHKYKMLPPPRLPYIHHMRHKTKTPPKKKKKKKKKRQQPHPKKFSRT
jgi:hypothetical protein